MSEYSEYPIATKRIVACPVCAGTGSQIVEDRLEGTSVATVPRIMNCFLCFGSGLTTETATKTYAAYWPRGMKENFA